VKGNSFDLDVRTERADFLSLDHEELAAPRKPDGSLPEIRYLRLSPRSRLIGSGVDLGEPYRGKAPDPGAFESGGP